MAEWQANIVERTATHTSGLVVRFTPADDTPGAWDGKIDQPIPTSIPLDASAIARMMREAGDAFIAAIKKQGETK